MSGSSIDKSTTQAPGPTLLVNGRPCRLPSSGVLLDLLAEHGLNPEAARGVAVAVNERIVRKADWAERQLAAGDTIEIVTARQGG
ncbi:MAG: sulfur carrier protein ThiS [Rhodothermales bacterium]